MNFPKGSPSSAGSVKARSGKHRSPLVLTVFLVLTLALLMTSLMWTPAEALYRAEGYTILLNGRPVLSTVSAQEAEDILEAVRNRYLLEGTQVLEADFKGRVTVEAGDVALQDVMNVEEGLAYILDREKPLLTVISKQKYVQLRKIKGDPAWPEGKDSFEIFEKARTENYTGMREYGILLTLENDRVIAREIADKKLILATEDPTSAKGLPVTEEVPIAFALELIPPVPLNVTCAYGESRTETGYHLGVDLHNPGGTPILAAAAGVVSHVGDGGSYGNLIILDHGGGVQTYYAHCRSVEASLGQTVEAGDYIGAVGSTGRTTGDHLHLELRLNGITLDPMDYL